MALAGATMEVIARELGWKDKSSAARAVKDALAAANPLAPEEMDRLRSAELARLDRLWQAHWVNALRGDQRAADTCLRISDRRSKLLGLDQPVTQEVVLTSKLDQEIQALLDRMPSAEDRPAADR